MKVLQLTTSKEGGAGIAALRLHNALRESGIASGFLSKELTIDFDNQVVDDPFFRYKRLTIFQRIKRKLRLLIFPTKAQKLQGKKSSVTKRFDYEMLSLPFSVYDLLKHPLIQEASILNLHMMSDILDYESFFNSWKKPIVWTLHDMNPFLGLFHYREDDMKYSKATGGLDVEIRRIKKEAISKCNKGSIITPSEWLLKEAEKSKVFDHFLLKKNIANSIDLDTFHIHDSDTLRREMGIAAEDFVLLFISGKLNNSRKGSDILIEALSIISDLKITVLMVGEGQIKDKIKNIKILPLGRVSDASEMAKYYAMANAFVLPSREDNLPNVMLEAFACGTPVVSFPIGGMKEHVVDNYNGILAQEISASALANAIVKAHDNKENFDRSLIREYAEEHFDYRQQAAAYSLIYRELLK